jgi:hypothetical protein
MSRQAGCMWLLLFAAAAAIWIVFGVWLWGILQ